MNKTTKGILDVILYIIVFIVIQIAVQYAAVLIWASMKGQHFQMVLNEMVTGKNAALLAVSTAMSGLITLVLFLRTRWTPVTRDYLQSRPWVTLLWVALFTLGLMIPNSFLMETLNVQMPEQYEQMFERLMKEPWGFVAVGVMAPIVEEAVFRGAILRTLLSLMGRKWHWAAICISALLFGAVHGNSAQFVNAAVLGLFIGWMYWRTKSLVPGIVLHLVNNSTAYILCNLLPQSNGKLIDLFGGDQKVVYYAVGFSLCIAIPSFIQVITRMKK
jgi:uncharacterized protein